MKWMTGIFCLLLCSCSALPFNQPPKPPTPTPPPRQVAFSYISVQHAGAHVIVDAEVRWWSMVTCSIEWDMCTFGINPLEGSGADSGIFLWIPEAMVVYHDNGRIKGVKTKQGEILYNIFGNPARVTGYIETCDDPPGCVGLRAEVIEALP